MTYAPELPAARKARRMGRRRADRVHGLGAFGGGAERVIASLVLVAAIPVLLFGGWIAYVTADRGREESRAAAVATVNRVAAQITAELMKELEIAEALAGSADLDAPDLPEFYQEAQRLTAARPLWETVSLTSADGNQILNILRPLGDPLGPVANQQSFAEAVERRRSAIGGIGPVGPISGKRLVALNVPVVRQGNLRYILTVGLVPSGISAVLREAGAPPGWIGAIVDAQGTIVARTIAEDAEIGRPASASVLAAIRGGAEGFYTGRTLEGLEVETVYRKLSRPIGWSVHFGVPAAALHTPVLRSLFTLAAGALASLALGGGVAWLVAHDFAQRRREEASRAALALSVSEERGAVAVDAAELGTWRWDAGTRQVMGSARCASLLGLPPALTGGPETTWSADRFLAAFADEHRPLVADAIRHCLDADVAIDLEVQAVPDDGARHWVRITGRRPQGGPPESAVVHGVISDVEPRKRAERERLRLLRRLAEAQENEQRRIARELHDQVGQTVTGLSLGLKGIEKALEAGRPDPSLRDQVRWLQNLTNEIGRDIHRAASDLRPTAIDDLGLCKALAAYMEEWSKIFGVRGDVQAIGQVRRLPLPIETAIYRVAQEALTNVVKHAEAASVSIVLEYRDQALRVVIEDDGKGIEASRIDAVGRGVSDMSGRICLGITGMQERLAMLDGSFAIESAPGSGTTLFIEVPLPADEDAAERTT